MKNSQAKKTTYAKTLIQANMWNTQKQKAIHWGCTQ